MAAQSEAWHQREGIVGGYDRDAGCLAREGAREEPK